MGINLEEASEISEVVFYYFNGHFEFESPLYLKVGST
jgi:hypothetical protein